MFFLQFGNVRIKRMYRKRQSVLRICLMAFPFGKSYLRVRAQRRLLVEPLAGRIGSSSSMSNSGSRSDSAKRFGFSATKTGPLIKIDEVFLRLEMGLSTIGTLGSSSGTWMSLSGSITIPESSDSTSMWMGMIRTTGGLRVVDCLYDRDDECWLGCFDSCGLCLR